MTTPELLGFVRSELAKGRTREAIHNDLIHGGGWKPEDIEEAFAEIAPAPVTPPVPIPEPVQTPVPAAVITPEPAIAATPEPIAPVLPPNLPIEPIHEPVPVQPLVHPIVEPEPIPTILYPTAQPASAPIDHAPIQPAMQPVAQPTSATHTIVEPSVPVAKKSKPYFLWGMLAIVFSTILLVIGVFLNGSALAVLAIGSIALGGASLLGLIIPIIFIMDILFVLLAAWIIHIVTKLSKVTESSWHKAIFAAGCFSLIAAISMIIGTYAHFATSLTMVTGLLFLGLQIWILAEVYSIPPLKAFFIGLLSLVIFLIIAAVIGLIFYGIASSLHSNQQQPTTYQNLGTPSTTAYPITGQQ